MGRLKKLDVKLVDSDYQSDVDEPLRNSKQLYGIFKSLKDEAYETCVVVYINEDLRIVYDVHSLGANDGTNISVPKLFGHGFLLKATYFAIIHNHPKGDAEPSPADSAAIQRLVDLQETTNIKLLDFIIVGDTDYWSYFDEQGGGEYSLGVITV